MCELRKVKFRIISYEFNPDDTSEQRAEKEELTKPRNGYFHRWVDDVDTSKDIPFIKTLALVEDVQDGTLYKVEYDMLNFISESR